jgi:hypothetical protein
MYGLSMTTEWGEPQHHAVGGLTEAGFDVDSGLLLVVSHQGRGVYDPRTGQRLARDTDETFDWFDERTLLVEGVGPLAGRHVRVTGLAGGAPLAQTTADGWSVRPADDGFSLTGPDDESLLVGDSDEARVWGFSPDGRSVLLGTSSTLTTLSRL